MSTLGGEQLRNIIITNYVVSSFSLAGSLGIVASYIAFPQLRNFSYSLVLYLAISEAFYSVSNMLGNPPNASATCYVQSVMQSYFLLSAILWNAAIAYLLKNAILYPEKVLGITKSMPRYHAYCWGVPFILTVLPAATGSYGSSGAWCWIKSSTAGEFWRFFQLYLPLWAVMGYNIQMYLSVRSVLNSVEGISTSRALVLFPMIVVVCWIFGSINRLQNMAAPSHPQAWLFLLQVAFGNSIGFFHFIAFAMTPPVQQAFGTYLGYSYPSERASFADDGSEKFLEGSVGDIGSGRSSRSITADEKKNAGGVHDGKNLKDEDDGKFPEAVRPRRRSSALQDVSRLVRGAYIRELGIYQLIGINSNKKNVVQVYDILQERYTIRATAPIAERDPEDISAGGERRPLVSPEKTTTTGAYLTLMKAFVGIGILAMPGAYAEAGYVLATVFLVIIAVVSYYCAILLIKAKNIIVERHQEEQDSKMGGGTMTSDSSLATNTPTPVITFQELGLRVMGERGKALVEGGIVVCQTSFVCAYFLFIGDSVERVIGKEGFIYSGTFYTLVATVAVVPLLYLKSIKLLVIPAILADVIIVFGLIVIFTYDFIRIDKVHESVSAAKWAGLPLFFGIAVFAFEGINMILPVEQSMKEPEKFPGVLRQVVLHLTIVMVLIGALSYSAYGSGTQNPILFSLPENVLLKVVQLLYAVALFFSVPLQMFPAFSILESYKCFESVFNGNMYIHRLCVIFISGGVASVVPNFGLFLNLIGAVGGTATAFILPSYLYMATTKNFADLRPLAACLFGAFGGFIAFVVSCIAFAKGG